MSALVEEVDVVLMVPRFSVIQRLKIVSLPTDGQTDGHTLLRGRFYKNFSLPQDEEEIAEANEKRGIVTRGEYFSSSRYSSRRSSAVTTPGEPEEGFCRFD